MIFTQELENHFKEQKITIILYPDPTEKSFSSLNEFYEFMLKEKEFWEICTDSDMTVQIYNRFVSIVNNIEKVTTIDNLNFNQEIDLIDNAIRDSQENSFPCIYSVTPQAKFIKERYGVHYSQADAACDYLFNSELNHSLQNDKAYLIGILSTFLFNDGNKFNRSENEKQALLDLRTRFSQEFNTLHDQYKQWTNEYNSFKDTTEQWRIGFQQTADNFLNNKKQKLEELEQLYRDKLRLEGPATYWKDTSQSYSEKGRRWRLWATISTFLFIVYLTILLYNLPESWARGSGLSYSSIKSTIIFTLIASMGIYIINLFVKLSTSAYHLARDANERFQLTHVYLSLLKEQGASEAAERSIILQSIFSRADTGLLKRDSAPTMPDVGILSQILKNIKQ